MEKMVAFVPVVLALAAADACKMDLRGLTWARGVPDGAADAAAAPMVDAASHADTPPSLADAPVARDHGADSPLPRRHDGETVEASGAADSSPPDSRAEASMGAEAAEVQAPDSSFPDGAYALTDTAVDSPRDGRRRSLDAARSCGYETPKPGYYKGEKTRIGDGGRSSAISFELVEGKDASALTIRYSADSSRYDLIPVTCGSFSYAHGWGTDGTDCAADGYRISGTFISETGAEGHYASAHDCKVASEWDFSVEFTRRP